MGLPRIDVTTCVVLATSILGTWVRLKLPMGWPHHETSLRRQNMRAYWAFGVLIALEIASALIRAPWMRWALGPACVLVFYSFAITTSQSGQRFWSKRRNQCLGLFPILIVAFALALLVSELSFVPLFTAFAVSQICHKKYVSIVYSSIQDLETLQAKILKQEAVQANLRHFKQPPPAESSQEV